MKYSILFLFLIGGQILLAQIQTKQDRIDLINKTVKHSGLSERNAKLLSLVKDISEKDFKSQEDFVDYLVYFQDIIVKDEPKEAELTFKIGKILNSMKFHLESFPFLYRTGEIVHKAEKKYDFECDYYETIGGSYFYFKRYEESESAYKKGLACYSTSQHSKINIYNTLGLIKSEQKQYAEAEKNYRTALKIASETNNEAWIGVITGNLGNIYYLLDDPIKATEYLKKDFQLSVAHNEIGSAINAYSLLIHMDVNSNRIQDAGKKLLTLDSLIDAHENSGTVAGYFSAKTSYLEKIGDFKNALLYYRKYIRLQDSLAAKRNLVNFNNTEFQIQFEKSQSEIKLLEERQRTDTIRINSLYIIAIVILLGAIVIIWQIVKRRKREKEIFELKNQRMQDNLERSKLELKNVLNNLIEKNQTVSKLTEELQAIHELQNDQSELERAEINDKLHSFTLLTDEDWLNFKRLFEKLHPGFFEYFHSNHEEITNAEVRLAALIKLNLENLEMSKALGISPDSVRKTNLRLRKRLDIADQKDLQKLIFSIS